VGVVGLNQFGFFKASDEHPITKYIASTIPSREQILRENLDRIEIVKERAATYRLSKNAQQDTFKPYRNPGCVHMYLHNTQMAYIRVDLLLLDLLTVLVWNLRWMLQA
jgi:hypothetical protein